MFVHSLEMGHTAGTRAVKAMGEGYIHAVYMPSSYSVKSSSEMKLFLYHESVDFHFFVCL